MANHNQLVSISRQREWSVDVQGGDANASDAADDGQDTFVWGTNLAIASVTRRIRNFYTTYQAQDAEDAGGEAKYQALIRQVCLASRLPANWP